MSTLSKSTIIKHIKSDLDLKIHALEIVISETKNSRNSETKSSAGDKHETARAMAQIELENNQKQLLKTIQLKSEIEKIKLNIQHNKISFGSLINTSNGIYFIAIGIGKISIKNTDIYVISTLSPIGKLLLNHKINDTINFNGKNIKIEAIN